MHDHHAVETLIERLAKAGLSDVTEVRIRAGAVFSPEALEQSYEMLTRDTPLAGSRLVVDRSPKRRTCPVCGSTWTVTEEDLAGHMVLCPSCGSAAPIEGEAAIDVIAVVSSGETRRA